MRERGFPLLKEEKKQENKIVGEMIADAYALKNSEKKTRKYFTCGFSS